MADVSVHGRDEPMPRTRLGKSPTNQTDEVFAGQWRLNQSRPDSFAEQQMKLAKLAVEDLLDTGSKLVEVLQGMCARFCGNVRLTEWWCQRLFLLASFYKTQGRYVDLCHCALIDVWRADCDVVIVIWS